MTTLSDGTTTLALPADLYWQDEFAHQAVAETRSRALHGAQLVDRAVRLAGRPITLAGARQHAWITRTTALALYAWAQQPGLALQLVYRGSTYSVSFNQDQQPVEWTPIVDYANPQGGDFGWPVLRFYTRA